MSQSKPLQPWRNRPNPYSGTPGPQGPPGEDGAEWHSVSGTPAGSLGSVGDWALDAATGQVWQKTGSATWTSRGSLRGPQGVQGETGPAGTITGATATGLAAGASPTVTLGGTASARTFAFGIPKGDKGEQGIQGPQGIKGDPGGAGVLGGGRGIHLTPQSIPNATWTVVDRAGSGQSWFYIVDGTVTVFAGFQMHCRVNSAGWWMVGASLCWDGNSTGRRIMAVETWTGTDPGLNNGATIVRAESPAGQSSLVSINGSTVAYLAANTNVRMLAYQNSGSPLSTRTEAPTELWLTRIL